MNAELQKAGTSGRADAVSTNKLSKQGAAAPAADLADEAVPTTVKARKSEKVSHQPSYLWHALSARASVTTLTSLLRCKSSCVAHEGSVYHMLCCLLRLCSPPSRR